MTSCEYLYIASFLPAEAEDCKAQGESKGQGTVVGGISGQIFRSFSWKSILM